MVIILVNNDHELVGGWSPPVMEKTCERLPTNHLAVNIENKKCGKPPNRIVNVQSWWKFMVVKNGNMNVDVWP